MSVVAPATTAEMLRDQRQLLGLRRHELAGAAGLPCDAVAALEECRPGVFADETEMWTAMTRAGRVLGLDLDYMAGPPTMPHRLTARREAIDGPNRLVSPPPALDTGSSGPAPRPRLIAAMRAAIGITAVAVGVLAGLVTVTEMGLFPGRPAVGAPADATLPTTTTTTPPLLVSGTTTPTSQVVAVASRDYDVTVSDARPCWAEILDASGHVLFAGIVQGTQIARIHLSGPSLVQLGAGGANVLVSSGNRFDQISPSAAPFSISLQPA